MEKDDSLQEIMFPAFDVSYRVFGHGPPGKIWYFKIIFLSFRFYYTNDFNFTKAMDEIE